jgi:hypothetical protein
LTVCSLSVTPWPKGRRYYRHVDGWEENDKRKVVMVLMNMALASDQAETSNADAIFFGIETNEIHQKVEDRGVRLQTLALTMS